MILTAALLCSAAAAADNDWHSQSWLCYMLSEHHEFPQQVGYDIAPSTDKNSEP